MADGRLQPSTARGYAMPVISADEAVALISPGARARRSKRLLLYVHVPFCSSKCHFCDWVQGVRTADLIDAGELRSAYVDAVSTQIRWYAEPLRALGYQPTNVYWGGGTPTRLSANEIGAIAGALSTSFDLSAVEEHTVESSPETLTDEKLDALKRAGATRISVGVQSFDDAILHRMGRSHDAALAEAAIRRIQEGGVSRFNIDLITSFPDQSVDSVERSIDRAIELEVPHISLYPFRHVEALVAVRQANAGHRIALDAPERTRIYLTAKKRLERAGYEEYITNYFARAPEHHFDSEAYYFGLYGDFIGFGAGALSHLGRCMLKRGLDVRREGAVDVHGFIARPTDFEMGAKAEAAPPRVFIDFIVQLFMMPEGVDYARWHDHFGFEFQRIRAHPVVRALFDRYALAGAVLVEDAQGIRIRADTRARANVVVLAER
jgi:oxygen-independent coproporphyrinogen-3 oxidase